MLRDQNERKRNDQDLVRLYKIQDCLGASKQEQNESSHDQNLDVDKELQEQIVSLIDGSNNHKIGNNLSQEEKVQI